MDVNTAILLPPESDNLPLNTIRVESALSRHPVHRLSTNQKGVTKIDLQEHNELGKPTFKWEVIASEYGHPGPLAYKIDTLIVNRRIEEAHPRLRRLLKLGSISDISRELGLADSGNNRANVKKALYQNAFTGIRPYISYKHTDGRDRTLETGFHRYSVIFTGDELPNGKKADAVYILLNDIYLSVLKGAMTRPLDYDYLKNLPPSPQRFYELLSFRMYGALLYDRPRAKLVYSEYCGNAPQARHDTWKRVRSQMTSIHRIHQESGYIAEVDYQEITDKDGHPDWIMLYKPGPKARAEYRAFAKRGGPTVIDVEPFDDDLPALPFHPDESQETPSPLAAKLTKRGVSAKTISDLMAAYPPEFIEQQIQVCDWLIERRDKKVATSPAGYLVKSIIDGYAVPSDFVSPAEQQTRQNAREEKQKKIIEASHEQDAKLAREREMLKKADAHRQQLAPADRIALESNAIAAAKPELRTTYENALRNALHKGVADRLLLGMIASYLNGKPELEPVAALA
jgi:hypothetical protein